MKGKVFLLALCIGFVCLGCRKKPDPIGGGSTIDTVQLKIAIENMVNGEKLALKTRHYTNANGDSFTVKTYKYYISNIKLTTTDGQEFAEPESYHLVDESKPESKNIVIKGLPETKYKTISFLIGVDSTRNVSGAQTGALDPANGMFWDWNTGYIMAMLEGEAPASEYGILGFHLGGFAANESVLRKVVLSLPSEAVVSKTNAPVIHLTSDVGEWFKTPSMVDFKKLSLLPGVGPDAILIADNYADMFKVEHID